MRLMVSTQSIVEVIADGDYYGMQTFDQALVKLVKEGLVAEDDARRASTNPHDFDLALMGVMERRTAMPEQKAAVPPSLSWNR